MNLYNVHIPYVIHTQVFSDVKLWVTHVLYRVGEWMSQKPMSAV